MSTLEEHLRQIETSLPYLKVTRSGIDELSQEHFFHDLQVAMGSVTRKAFSTLIESALKRYPKRRSEDEAAYQLRVLPMSKAELWDLFKSNKKIAFEEMGGDFDEAFYWNAAEQMVAKKYADLRKKIRESRDPFQYATLPHRLT